MSRLAKIKSLWRKFGNKEWARVQMSTDPFYEENVAVLVEVNTLCERFKVFEINHAIQLPKFLWTTLLYATKSGTTDVSMIAYFLQQGQESRRFSVYALAWMVSPPDDTMFTKCTNFAYKTLDIAWKSKDWQGPTDIQEISEHPFTNATASRNDSKAPKPTMQSKLALTFADTPHPTVSTGKQGLHQPEVPSKTLNPCSAHGIRAASAQLSLSNATHNMQLELAKQLFDTYDPLYRPPEFSLLEEQWKTFDWHTIAYYVAAGKADEAIFRRLLREREPVNIEWSRPYDKEALYGIAGYRVGAYRGQNRPYVVVAHASVLGIPDHFLVCNAPGFAFDHPNQPDVYRFVLKDDENQDALSRDACEFVEIQGLSHRLGCQKYLLNKTKLILGYTQLWYLILICASKHNCGLIFSGALGGNNFSPWGSGHEEQFIRDIQDPAVSRARKRCGVQIPVLPYPGFIPEILATIRQSSSPRPILWINAWDQFSVVGNGNNADSSLDGHWGRNSNLAVLTWPVINGNIEYIAVPWSEAMNT